MSSRPGSLLDKGAPEGKDAQLEQHLRKIASNFSYPITPNLAGSERQRLKGQRPMRLRTARRLARAGFGLALLLILFAAALLTSPVRARVLDWIGIGSVRIFFLPTPTQPVQPTPTYLRSVLELAGETSLSAAQEQADFTIQLPTYPADLGQPAHVYLQQVEGTAVVILAWMDSGKPEQVRMSLTESPSDWFLFRKIAPKTVQETQVNGQPALWVEGDYMLVMHSSGLEVTRLVNQGHTLIWDGGKITFRLETDTDLETAIRIAESIP